MIKEKHINYIEHADNKRLEEMYSLLGLENDEEDERKTLVQEERAKYLNGEGRSFSPEEVKARALNKSQRHA
jgi:hypothetical protein